MQQRQLRLLRPRAARLLRPRLRQRLRPGQEEVKVSRRPTRFHFAWLVCASLVGLGNPGADYLRTRHNAGFWFIDALAQQLGARFGVESKLHAETAKASIGGQSVLLLKPTTFMNKSGIAVASALRYYKIAPDEMLVAHDELDLPPGTTRLKFDGGHGGQNGLRDIIAHLGDGKFHRLRVGIGHPGHKDKVTGWVLGRAARKG